MILGYWVILGLNWGYGVILGYLYRLWGHCVGVMLELESVMGRGFACDFSRGSLVTSQFGSLVTSCFLSSRNAELSWFSENRVSPKP